MMLSPSRTHTFMFTYRPTDTQHIIKRERFLINMILTYRSPKGHVFLSIKCKAAVYSSFTECGTQRICNELAFVSLTLTFPRNLIYMKSIVFKIKIMCVCKALSPHLYLYPQPQRKREGEKKIIHEEWRER